MQKCVLYMATEGAVLITLLYGKVEFDLKLHSARKKRHQAFHYVVYGQRNHVNGT